MLKGSQKFFVLGPDEPFWKLLIWPKDMGVDKVADEVADMVKRNDSSLCFACGDVLILTTSVIYFAPDQHEKKRNDNGVRG